MDKYELLMKAKEILQYEIIEFTYTMVIDPMEIEIYDDEQIVLVVPTSSQKSMIMNSCIDAIETTFRALTKKSHNIVVLENNELPDFLARYSKTNLTVESSKPSNINPSYTFDTFIVGDNNRIAHAASEAVAKDPSGKFNPLFIYGGPGLGKTHLMHAVANQVLKTNPNYKILYVSSEKFLNELVNSIRNKETDTEFFRKKYRNIDLFLMDDVQFLSGKETAQTELFNTFNELYENNKQIVLSADQPPKDIPVLEERLKSRFNQGVIVDINKPNYETRLAILRQKTEEKNIIIEDFILGLIAERIDSNIRDLEGVLNKVVVISSLTNMPITIEATEKAINEIALERENLITPNSIIEVISQYFNISTKDILSSKKSKDLVFPRQIAMYLCRNELELSYKKVGEIFGKKDHTTIMHAETKILEAMKVDKQTKLIVDSVENILRNRSK